MVYTYQVGTQTSTELLELVSYCATKSLYASSDMSFSVAEQLQKFADDICLVCYFHSHVKYLYYRITYASYILHLLLLTTYK